MTSVYITSSNVKNIMFIHSKMNEPFRITRGGGGRRGGGRRGGGRRRPHRRWPHRRIWYNYPVYLQPAIVQVEPTELELECRKVAVKHPVDFDHHLHQDAHKNYMELCKDPTVQKIIKEKVLDIENYRYIVVPSYGPSNSPLYGEPYQRQGEGPFGNPDLIGVL